MPKFYTGVGSRKTPPRILKIMEKLATSLEKAGFILRSGGAKGADTAFEKGIQNRDNVTVFTISDSTLACEDIAKQFHPVWNSLSAYAKQLHGRSAKQVLGHGLCTPSKFLVCWTPDGAKNHAERSIETGGTGTAISIAWSWVVPVFNLTIQSDLDRITKFIK